MTPERNPPNPAASPGTPPEPGERAVDSRELLGPTGDLLIRHEGRTYRLRRTRIGKLILTA